MKILLAILLSFQLLNIISCDNNEELEDLEITFEEDQDGNLVLVSKEKTLVPPPPPTPPPTDPPTTTPEPDPVEIDDFTVFAHDLSSSGVTLLDERTIQIDDFHYDGQGPAAWFYLGNDDTYNEEFTPLTKGIRIPNEDGSCGSLAEYNGENIKIRAPVNVQDYDFLSVYCTENQHNFGFIKIPDDVKLRKYKGKAKSVDCEGGNSYEQGGLNFINPAPQPPGQRPNPNQVFLRPRPGGRPQGK